MSRYQHLIFDLDGTLIDSAPAILASFREAFATTGITPAVPIDESVIGPPLLETLQLLSGSTEAATTERLAAAFKASYDSTGLLETRAYEGVGEMLAGLAARGRTLHIATNKRIHPTRLILRHLGWAGLFENVYALDLFEPRLKDKAAMIRRLLEDRQIPLGDALYIGDREEDGSSAEANALPFIAATWGYGALTAAELRPDWRMAKNPAALAAML
ncbi:MAG: HAD hydrolase-like protein [Rhodocyclaceae bacterium]|jgi:phosphoglycolate phosphatase|nr:HAD hydrolase-like protein [Rhodocyclaceae bacterium]MCP5255312.1 HAD hydrolase-like protein [Zoogloeaceae bacterium]MCP5294810.1 HAD hydrolase-like protein [Zoogloeaceae bacterium]